MCTVVVGHQCVHSGSGSVQGSSVHTVSEYLQGQLLWPLKSGSTVTMVATGWVCIPMVVGSGGHEVLSQVYKLLS